MAPTLYWKLHCASAAPFFFTHSALYLILSTFTHHSSYPPPPPPPHPYQCILTNKDTKSNSSQLQFPQRVGVLTLDEENNRLKGQNKKRPCWWCAFWLFEVVFLSFPLFIFPPPFPWLKQRVTHLLFLSPLVHVFVCLVLQLLINGYAIRSHVLLQPLMDLFSRNRVPGLTEANVIL